MAIPNGVGSLLSKAQSDIFEKAGGKKLLFSAKGAESPVEKVAVTQLKDFSIKPKKKPTVEDVLKLSAVHSMGFLLLNNTLEKGFGLEAGKLKKEGGLKSKNEFFDVIGFPIKKLFTAGMGVVGTFIAGLLPKIGSLITEYGPKLRAILANQTVRTATGIISIAGGALMMIQDGMEGAEKAKEWGVSKLTAGIAAALTSSSKGWGGALEGAKKYGLIGAGLGMIIPVIGPAIGGIVGAGIGSILGAIGGERTAKFFQKTGEYIKKAGLTILDTAGKASLKVLNYLDKSGKTAKIWQSDLGVEKKMLYTIGSLGSAVWNAASSGFEKLKNFASDAFKKLTTQEDGTKNLLGKAIDGLLRLPSRIAGMLDNVIGDVVGEETWAGIKTFFKDTVIGSVQKFFSGIGEWLSKTFGGVLKIFGIGADLEKEMAEVSAYKAWVVEFQKTARYKELLQQSIGATMEGGSFALSLEDLIREEYEKSKKNVKDAVFKLEKSMSKGSLFSGGSPNISFDKDDELYLMASTNPAKDKLVASVDNLAALIAQLAAALQKYQPQTNTLSTTIENNHIPLKELLALPRRGMAYEF